MRLFATLVLVCAAHSAHAYDYTIIGAPTCATWLASAAEPERRPAQLAWVLGHLSALSYIYFRHTGGIGKDPLDPIAGGATVATILDARCAIAPEASLERESHMLFEALIRLANPKKGGPAT